MSNNTKKKKLINFSLPADIVEDFKELSKKRCINKSLLVEKWVTEWIKKCEMEA